MGRERKLRIGYVLYHKAKWHVNWRPGRFIFYPLSKAGLYRDDRPDWLKVKNVRTPRPKVGTNC